MPDSFGARLRQRREEQGISLSAIAEQTKIKQSLLEALERDDVRYWPTGLYRRAFMRAYARAINLDTETVLKEFLEVHPEPPDVDVIAAMASVLDGPDRTPTPTTRIRHAVGSALESLARLRRGPASDEVAAPPARADVPAELVLEAEPAVVDPEPAAAASGASDLAAVADLCAELGAVATADDMRLVLQKAAALLDAMGLIVWTWDSSAEQLRPVLVHGYSERMLAQLPAVGREADNATAEAFRSSQPCVVAGGRHGRGALVVPLLSRKTCAGVLAIELRGREPDPPVRAIATIVASLLAQLTINVGSVSQSPYELQQPAV